MGPFVKIPASRADPDRAEWLQNAYSLALADVLEGLDVDPNTGIRAEVAAERLAKNGPNSLESRAGKGALKILLSQFNSIVVWLLLAAAVVAFITDGPLEAGAIAVVLVLNAAIGFVIEWQAGKALDALRRTTVATARVRRNGTESVIDAAGIVPGDIIVLSAGDRVPADARLIEAAMMRTDESTLTGESAPVEKSSEASPPGTLLADRSSMIYLGSNVVSGRGLAAVTATAGNTEIGRIGQLLETADDKSTPLERRLADLGKRLVYVVLGVAGAVMVAGYLRGDEPLLMAKISISLAVAAVPEGLPAVTTLILALGVLRMARQSAIVRTLSAVETLGSTTVICTDKTGTLTENRMTVLSFTLGNGRDVSVPERPSAAADTPDAILNRLLKVGVLCSEAAAGGADGETVGDPTETALLVAAGRFGLALDEVRNSVTKDFEVPFDSATKRMISVFRERDGRRLAMVKGAPSVILDSCATVADDGGHLLLNDMARSRLLEVNEELASRGLRVLALADKDLTDTSDEGIEGGYTLLGFASMTDPPRPEVKAAIKKAQDAGIRIVMLTGDQAQTAKAIAAELRLSAGDEVVAVHARELMNSDPEKLAETARQVDVFARVSPEDKLRIVESLQVAGEIVAVTGDGVNDAPALKQADIGVAMGKRGTDVAKEAADVVLTDDNFSTIVTAIESGRTIYANIIKFVHLMFSHNLGEILIIFGAILLALPLPLFPLQILWINLVTDIFPALALALEPPSADTMKRGPRSPKEALLSRPFMFLIGWQGAMLAAISLAAYVWALQIYGEGPHARTVAMLSLVGVQVGHLFNCRSRRRSTFVNFFGNPNIFWAVGIVGLLQAAAIYFEPLRNVLGLVEPGQNDWLVIGASVIAPILIVEATKIFAGRIRADIRSA